ncbi:MAG: Sua5/YciO/YrdC/YwlC family protein [Planctomycetes bacterium]|nr:Sua5/YciO/YrdC/YwlC family protein [Planctomycetota bacterium]
MPAHLLNSTQVSEAADLLLDGELVGFPTETVYGVAALADVDLHSQKLQAFKGGRSNPFAVHVPSVDYALELLRASGIAAKSIQELAPHGITVIIDGVGIRVVTHELGAEFLEKVGRPVVATSANSPSQPPLRAPNKIAELDGIAAVLDAGVLPERPASTVVRVLSDRLEILREGAGDIDLVNDFSRRLAEQTDGDK